MSDRSTKAAISLSEAQNNLAAAQDGYREASRIEEDARRKKTAAINMLNLAQKEFDAAVKWARAFAPPETDWGARRDV